MDLAEIALAAIGGGAGALVGSLLGGLFGLIFLRGKGDKPNMIAIILTVGLTVAGSRFMPDILEPYIGETVRGALAEGDIAQFEADVIEGMETEPFFIVGNQYAPERAEAWREAVFAAYRSGGEDAAMTVSHQHGEEIGAWLVAEYTPRATDENLEAFYRAMLDLLQGPLSTRPAACYTYFFSVQVPGAAEQMAEVDLNSVLNAMVQLPAGAAETPVAYDAALGGEVQMAAGQAALQRLGAGNEVLFGQRMAENEAEYALACSAMGAFLETMLAHEHSGPGMRALAAASAG